MTDSLCLSTHGSDSERTSGLIVSCAFMCFFPVKENNLCINDHLTAKIHVLEKKKKKVHVALRGNLQNAF